MQVSGPAPRRGPPSVQRACSPLSSDSITHRGRRRTPVAHYTWVFFNAWFLGRPETVDLWGSGRPLRPPKPFQKLGSEAPHLLEWFLGPPGPPRLQNIYDFQPAPKPCIIEGGALPGPKMMNNIKLGKTPEINKSRKGLKTVFKAPRKPRKPPPTSFGFAEGRLGGPPALRAGNPALRAPFSKNK
jgi:hypothetical protein